MQDYAVVPLLLPQHWRERSRFWAADEPEDEDLTYIQVTCLRICEPEGRQGAGI